MGRKTMNKIICQLCKDEVLDCSDVYNYRGFPFHEKCFDEGVKKVDEKRQEVMKENEYSLLSQSAGEWMNGGYRTMKTDITGKPIIKNPKQSQRLTDYENGIL